MSKRERLLASVRLPSGTEAGKASNSEKTEGYFTSRLSAPSALIYSDAQKVLEGWHESDFVDASSTFIARKFTLPCRSDAHAEAVDRLLTEAFIHTGAQLQIAHYVSDEKKAERSYDFFIIADKEQPDEKATIEEFLDRQYDAVRFHLRALALGRTEHLDCPAPREEMRTDVLFREALNVLNAFSKASWKAEDGKLRLVVPMNNHSPEFHEALCNAIMEFLFRNDIAQDDWLNPSKPDKSHFILRSGSGLFRVHEGTIRQDSDQISIIMPEKMREEAGTFLLHLQRTLPSAHHSLRKFCERALQESTVRYLN